MERVMFVDRLPPKTDGMVKMGLVANYLVRAIVRVFFSSVPSTFVLYGASPPPHQDVGEQLVCPPVNMGPESTV